jgi:hypothetical protein
MEIPKEKPILPSTIHTSLRLVWEDVDRLSYASPCPSPLFNAVGVANSNTGDLDNPHKLRSTPFRFTECLRLANTAYPVGNAPLERLPIELLSIPQLTLHRFPTQILTWLSWNRRTPTTRHFVGRHPKTPQLLAGPFNKLSDYAWPCDGHIVS